MVETLAVERSQNDGTEGSPSALMVDMVDGPSCQSEPSTIDEAAPRGRGRPTRPRRVRRASTSPSTARKWAYGRLPCAAFRAVAWRARAPVGRRPLFGRGASRRRKRGRRQRERAMVAMGDSLPSRMETRLGGWRPNGGTRG